MASHRLGLGSIITIDDGGGLGVQRINHRKRLLHDEVRRWQGSAMYVGGQSRPTLPRRVAVWGLTIAAGSVALLVQRPVIDTEPVFVIANAAVTVAMVAVGTYLAILQDEPFTGWCFAVAGLSWLFIAADIYPGWGGWIAFVIGGGAPFFVPIAWGILRYGRPRLVTRGERAFPLACAVLTSGLGAVWSLFNRPEWGGLPATDSWPALWPNPTFAAVGSALLSVGFVVAAVWLTLLLRAAYRQAPPTRRGAVRPLYLFGVVIALGSTVIYTIGDTILRQLSFHSLTSLIAVLALAMTTGLAMAMTSRQVFAAQLVATLPHVQAPETVSRYVHDVLGDDSAELLFWDSESAQLIDLDGAPRSTDEETGLGRFAEWVCNSDGERVALLTGSPTLRDDTAAVASLAKLVAVLAENISLQAVLRRRVAQLTAAKVAQQVAFEQARAQFRRDLHDGVQQTLASARMDLDGVLDAAERSDVTRQVADLDAKLLIALDQVRSLKRGGKPPELSDGLGAAIERVVAELRLNASTQLTTQDLGELTVPVYYVVREALTNVHKHASATSVIVNVATDGAAVTVTIEDDGVGGAAARPRGGVVGSRQRFEELGGWLEIESRPGSGTRVRASVPCV